MHALKVQEFRFIFGNLSTTVDYGSWKMLILIGLVCCVFNDSGTQARTTFNHIKF